MRRLFFDVVAVLLTVAALSGVAVVDATQEYVILRNACKRSSSTQDTCDQTLAKDRELLLAMCRDRGLYPGLILNETERRKVMSLMDSKGISRVYVGARAVLTEGITYWCWLADLWGFNGWSIFYINKCRGDACVYGPNLWLNCYPRQDSGNHVIFDHGASPSGLRNVDGNDDEPFDVLCEIKQRPFKPIASIAGIVHAVSTAHCSTSQPPPTTTRRPIPPPPTKTNDPTTSQNSASTQEPPSTGTGTTASPVSSESGEFPTWAIGLIIGGVLLLLIVILIFALCACCCCRCFMGAKESNQFSDESDSDDSSSEGSRSFLE